eukprot:TRINITY_DN3073_c0_g1_i1.p1 TRINITY_DN3073_c0_g1~~TRINITY_DN3073_c0_g1_i1.p1  ORF type:complete len:527 (+),score=81.68 TRINITY_DN3073_c0_g1_i1:529-2109(+)
MLHTAKALHLVCSPLHLRAPSHLSESFVDRLTERLVMMGLEEFSAKQRAQRSEKGSQEALRREQTDVTPPSFSLTHPSSPGGSKERTEHETFAEKQELVSNPVRHESGREAVGFDKGVLADKERKLLGSEKQRVRDLEQREARRVREKARELTLRPAARVPIIKRERALIREHSDDFGFNFSGSHDEASEPESEERRQSKEWERMVRLGIDVEGGLLSRSGSTEETKDKLSGSVIAGRSFLSKSLTILTSPVPSPPRPLPSSSSRLGNEDNSRSRLVATSVSSSQTTTLGHVSTEARLSSSGRDIHRKKPRRHRRSLSNEEPQSLPFSATATLSNPKPASDSDLPLMSSSLPTTEHSYLVYGHPRTLSDPPLPSPKKSVVKKGKHRVKGKATEKERGESSETQRARRKEEGDGRPKTKKSNPEVIPESVGGVWEGVTGLPGSGDRGRRKESEKERQDGERRERGASLGGKSKKKDERERGDSDREWQKEKGKKKSAPPVEQKEKYPKKKRKALVGKKSGARGEVNE